MNALEFNKYAAAFLFTLLALFIINYIADSAMAPHHLEESVYLVDGIEKVQKEVVEVEVPTLPVLLSEADVLAGQKVFRKCKACHTLEVGGKNKVGPNISNIVGRSRAANADFRYSSSLSDIGGNWGYADLDSFIADPKKSIPGTKMTFRGIKDATDRANLIMYLQSQTESPPPLPAVE